MSEYEFVKVEQDGRITLITINRPEVYNALHSPAHTEFDQVFNEFASDPEQWVAIITGAGDKAFSAGNDLKYQVIFCKSVDRVRDATWQPGCVLL